MTKTDNRAGRPIGRNILVVDDEPEFADFLCRGLTYEGYKVTVVRSAGEGWDVIMAGPPDLVLLDIGLPDLDGISLCRSLRLEGMDEPVLMLTARSAVADRIAGLDAGADDYLPKPFAFDELIARVKALLRRSGGDEEVLCAGELILNTRMREARRNDEAIPLTPKEFELLSFLLRHQHQILTRKAILSQVWGHDAQPESNILEVYIRRLRRKLGAPSVIETAHGVGYVVRDPGLT